MNFSDLYEEMALRLERLARCRCLDHTLAEDLVQETFLKAASNLTLLSGMKPAQRWAWLRTTFHNLFVDHIRREARQREVMQNYCINTELLFEHDEFEQVENDASAVEMLRLVPQTLRQALQLRFVHGLDSTKIGKRQRSRLKIGKLALDETYLQSLEDASHLMIIGKLSAITVLPAELLNRKIAGLHIIGKLFTRQENAAVLLSKCDDRAGQFKTETVPEGYEVIEKGLVIDNDTVHSLPSDKLYCSGTVRISGDMNPDELNRALSHVSSRQMIIFPASLRDIMKHKCDMLNNITISYDGELWLFDSEGVLRASRFEHLDGKSTLVVTGELDIDDSVEPSILAERIHKVHNMGEIRCNTGMAGALESRLGIDKGEIVIKGRDDEETEGSGTGNVGYLKL